MHKRIVENAKEMMNPKENNLHWKRCALLIGELTILV